MGNCIEGSNPFLSAKQSQNESFGFLFLESDGSSFPEHSGNKHRTTHKLPVSYSVFSLWVLKRNTGRVLYLSIRIGGKGYGVFFRLYLYCISTISVLYLCYILLVYTIFCCLYNSWCLGYNKEVLLSCWQEA